MLIPLLIFTACGDLEPDMQDKRSVILSMDFHGESSSRSSYSVSESEISEYNTHLILALPSSEYLTNSYQNYYSSFAQGLMNTADNKVILEIPLNTQMKIFAFLFKNNYSIYELFLGNQDVVYYGESSIFSISTNSDSLNLGVTLQTELEGSWKTSCYTYSDNTFSFETVTIEGNVITIIYEIHSDVSCTTDYMLVEESHTVSSLGDSVTFSNGKKGREFTVIIGSTQKYSLQSASAVSEYNSVSECGASDWQLNTEKECSNGDAGDTYYCLYQLDGNYFYPSCDSSSTPSTSSVNTLDESSTFVKQ
tara:strand:+ start:362 stop:1282 length:921 start_codon:yes stop_codon:yes gene_type:complete